MKLLVAVAQLDRPGGKERDCIAIARHLAARGHDVMICTSSGPDNAADPVPVKRLAVSGLSNHRRAERFAAAAIDLRDRTGADALLAFERIPGAEYFYAADDAFALRRQRWTWPARRRARLAIERAVFESPRLRRCIFVTVRQRDDYIRAYGPAVIGGIVLPPIVHEDRFNAGAGGATPAPAETRSRFGLPQDRTVAVSIAVKPQIKGVDRTLDAMAAFPDLHLLTVGSASPWLRRAISRRGLGDRVHVVAYSADIMEALSACDLLLHPARSEAGGLAIVEALLAGVPAVVTDNCGYAGEVSRSGAGVVVPAAFDPGIYVDAVRSVLSRLPELKQAAAAEGSRLRRERGRWLDVVTKAIEQRADPALTMPR